MYPAEQTSIAPRSAAHAGQSLAAVALFLPILLIFALGPSLLVQTTQQAAQYLLEHPTSFAACGSTTAATYSTWSPAYCVEGKGRVLAVSTDAASTGMWLKTAVPSTSADGVDVDWTKRCDSPGRELQMDQGAITGC